MSVVYVWHITCIWFCMVFKTWGREARLSARHAVSMRLTEDAAAVMSCCWAEGNMLSMETPRWQAQILKWMVSCWGFRQFRPHPHSYEFWLGPYWGLSKPKKQHKKHDRRADAETISVKCFVLLRCQVWKLHCFNQSWKSNRSILEIYHLSLNASNKWASEITREPLVN